MKVNSDSSLFNIKRRFRFMLQLLRDLCGESFGKADSFQQSEINRIFSPIDINALKPHASEILSLSDKFLQHKFNLLGSGWIEVCYGTTCPGFEEYVYPAQTSLPPTPLHRIDRLINRANRRTSAEIWSLIEEPYSGIDWQLDFRSGCRWSETTWYRHVRWGIQPGADIKLPWELARCQHFMILVWAYQCSLHKISGFHDPQHYSKEFRNQVLDFIAFNPPRFGANWNCTMDVAIRVSNWLIAYDLFCSCEQKFDEDFIRIFVQSVHDHLTHCLNNLEIYGRHTNNHYLANIVGLIFCSIYLPSSTETNDVLSCSVQKLLAEMKNQFHQDGSNFEDSTCYHRLSSEMTILAAAAILAASSEDQEVLPPWFWNSLERAVEFSIDCSDSNSQTPQIGDNDSGRLFKFNPQDFAAGEQSDLNHESLAAFACPLFERPDFARFTDRTTIETAVIRSMLSKVTALPQATTAQTKESGLCASAKSLSSVSDTDKNIVHANRMRCIHYPNFGIYLYKSDNLFFAIRCGTVGQRGNGGHSHNDLLSFVLHYQGIPFFVDPGTYVYTASSEKRNLLRSTQSHSTLSVNHLEQNQIRFGKKGLFSLSDQAQAEVITATSKEFVGKHHGFGQAHQRHVVFHDREIAVQDCCRHEGGKTLVWMLHPRVAVQLSEDLQSVELKRNDATLSLRTDDSTFAAKTTLFSPSYGCVIPSMAIRANMPSAEIAWRISW